MSSSKIFIYEPVTCILREICRDKNNNVVSDTETTVTKYMCLHCTKICIDEKTTNEHIISEHLPSEFTGRLNPNYDAYCTKCKTQLKQSEIEKHIEVHKEFVQTSKCRKCGMTVETDDKKESHIRNHRECPQSMSYCRGIFFCKICEQGIDDCLECALEHDDNHNKDRAKVFAIGCLTNTDGLNTLPIDSLQTIVSNVVQSKKHRCMKHCHLDITHSVYSGNLTNGLLMCEPITDVSQRGTISNMNFIHDTSPYVWE